MRNAPNSECLGQENGMHLNNEYALISELKMRLIAR